MIKLNHRHLLAASAIGTIMLLSTPAQARECLLDTNNDGTATTGVDTDGGALSSNTQDTACGVAAVATSSASTADTGDTDGATAFGALSLSVGPDTVAIGNDAIAGLRASGGAVTMVTGATAVGASAYAGADQASAFGIGARAVATSSIAMGAGALARGNGAIAIGAAADATTPGSTVMGNGAISTGQNAIALGNGARANGTSAVAHGDNAIASGANAIAYGSNSQATANGSLAFGTAAKGVRDNATAVGNNALAQGAQGSSFGQSALVIADGGTALGAGARVGVGHTNSTAVGVNSTTTAANQVTLGASGTSVRIGDIAASTAAQVGPVNAVTVDGNGTLGRQSVVTTAQLGMVTQQLVGALAVTEAQFADLSSRVDSFSFRLEDMNEETRGGIAAAMALGGTMVVPDSNISINLNAATYRGEQGFSGSLVARVAPRIYVSGGVAASTSKGSTGARVGLALGL